MSIRELRGLEIELSTVKVRALVEHNTDLSPRVVVKLGSGFDFDTYLLDDEWVFRFPLHVGSAESLAQERLILQVLEIGAQTPVIEYWVEHPIGFPVPFVGYRFIRGISLECSQLTRTETKNLAQDLGNVLSQTHCLPLSFKRVRQDPIPDRICSFKIDLANSSFLLNEAERKFCQKFLEQYRPSDSHQSIAMIHGDLGTEHVLLDGNKRLKGIIDWSNVRYDNRFDDFAGLWGWGGDSFVLEVLEHYGVQPSTSDWARIRAAGLMYCIDRLAYLKESKDINASLTTERVRSRIEEVSQKEPCSKP